METESINKENSAQIVAMEQETTPLQNVATESKDMTQNEENIVVCQESGFATVEEREIENIVEPTNAILDDATKETENVTTEEQNPIVVQEATACVASDKEDVIQEIPSLTSDKEESTSITQEIGKGDISGEPTDSVLLQENEAVENKSSKEQEECATTSKHDVIEEKNKSDKIEEALTNPLIASDKEEIPVAAEEKQTEAEEKDIETVEEPDNASNSDAEPLQKRKKCDSSQTSLDITITNDPENYDAATSNKETDNSSKGKITDKPIFMHIDTEKEDQEKPTGNENDELAIDPIGESLTDWSQDDTECIVPDTNQTQVNRNTANNGQANDNVETATSSAHGVVVNAIYNPEWDGKYVVTFSNRDEQKTCMICKKEDAPKYTCTLNKDKTFICSEQCLKQLKEQNVENVIVRDLRVKNLAPPPEDNVTDNAEVQNFRHCADCGLLLTNPSTYLSWESLEFCDTKCIKNYQKKIGSYCVACPAEVPEIYLGKYCVRFGFNIRQFCSGTCLIKYKKGFKVCSYCQMDLKEPKARPVNVPKIKGRDFCSETCQENYEILTERKMGTGPCAVCHKEKPIAIEFYDKLKGGNFCSKPCFVAFKYVNNVVPDKCGMCLKYYHKKDLPLYMMNDAGVIIRFCSRTCENVYVSIYRIIVSCCWCKVKKYNFDMIQKYDGTQCIMWCSLNCQRLYETNCSPILGKRRCAVCLKYGNMIYHITMDSGLQSFCSYKCVRDHQTKALSSLRVNDVAVIPSPVSKRLTRKSVGRKRVTPDTPGPLPIITSIRSLAPTSERTVIPRPITPETEDPIKYIIMVKPKELPDIRNVSTTVKPQTIDRETDLTSVMVDKETQTDIFNATDMEVVPVPIYIPQPIHMFNFLHLKPMPFPLPIPVPILMPMTKTGTTGILKEVKAAQPTPSDPFEADLLVMAQLVADANDKDADEEQGAESEPDDAVADDPPYSPEPPEQNTSFGDDVLQMALHMATDFTEPAVDLEGALTANTITATTPPEQPEEATPARTERVSRGTRKRGRSSRSSRSRGRGRANSQQPASDPEPTPDPPAEPVEKPDANLCLKYTFGVNAWKQWVTNKNNELEKSSRRVKLFKTDLLQLTSDELNYSLCLFIKEVRKPNGTEYAPDTIYYLCLGIQQYLFENGRIDNIFCDPYYESFTDCLDDICKKFSTLYNDSQYIVTRVEEEHLWESKQLGAHSPHVLLSTLMFFNTKHFNLTNVDEHMQLSFSHIMKHWKRVPNAPGISKNVTSRNILLRFYPPQSAVDGNRKKKVYEQQENEENPIRCPVKLYEFYLSKCPESVKTRNDVFYLQPERSCVPDSPVWYSTMALGKESLEKMLHRVKMVKEINVALLSS